MRVSTTVINTITLGMMTGCISSCNLTETGSAMTEGNGLHGRKRIPSFQNHPSYAINRMIQNKVSIEPRIVDGTYVSPPDKYSFMGALRPFFPFDEYHSTSYESICSTIRTIPHCWWFDFLIIGTACGATLITRTIVLSAGIFSIFTSLVCGM